MGIHEHGDIGRLKPSRSGHYGLFQAFARNNDNNLPLRKRLYVVEKVQQKGLAGPTLRNSNPTHGRETFVAEGKALLFVCG